MIREQQFTRTEYSPHLLIQQIDAAADGELEGGTTLAPRSLTGRQLINVEPHYRFVNVGWCDGAELLQQRPTCMWVGHWVRCVLNAKLHLYLLK